MCSYATSKRRLVGGGWPRLSRAAFPRERKSCFWNAFGHREGRACAPQRQPSFAIVSEIAIGGVDGRLQGTSHDIIRRDKVRIYTVSCATRRSMSRQGKEEWQKTKQRRFPFLLHWSLSLSLSPSLSSSFSLSLSFYPSSRSLSFFSGHFLADRRGISRLVDFRTTDELSSRFCGHSLWVVCCTMECWQPPTVLDLFTAYTHSLGGPAWEKPGKNFERFDGPLVVVIMGRAEHRALRFFDFEKLLL